MTPLPHLEISTYVIPFLWTHFIGSINTVLFPSSSCKSSALEVETFITLCRNAKIHTKQFSLRTPLHFWHTSLNRCIKAQSLSKSSDAISHSIILQILSVGEVCNENTYHACYLLTLWSNDSPLQNRWWHSKQLKNSVEQVPVLIRWMGTSLVFSLSYLIAPYFIDKQITNWIIISANVPNGPVNFIRKALHEAFDKANDVLFVLSIMSLLYQSEHI